MARAIIRYSVQQGRDGKTVRGHMRQQLRDAGFVRTGTATFEVTNVDLPAAAEAISQALTTLAGADLDSVWVYIDQPSAPVKRGRDLTAG